MCQIIYTTFSLLACDFKINCLNSLMISFLGTNTCPGYSSCKNFTEIYTDATDFCENVFDRTWKVVQNSSEPCMVLNFHDTNPNYNVAKQKAQSIYSNKSNTVKFGTMLYLLVVIMLTIPKM